MIDTGIPSRLERFQPLHIWLIESHNRVRDALTARLLASPLVDQVIQRSTLTTEIWPTPDLILIGLPQPLIDFDSVTHTTRALANAGAVVIVLSAYFDAAEQDQLLTAGATDYRLKQINTPALIDELMTIYLLRRIKTDPLDKEQPHV